ncbi:AbiU2 domain-containing protein [Roseibium aggregatum]|uniref:AbiU2 domain-containing protein n=1 Tax=Roseibium aggregatum TaxID=187304 RepID=UPI0006E2BAE2|nr:hypothetical protein [Roseibium aggregatum]
MGVQADNQLRLRIENWRDAFRDNTTGIHKTIDDLLWNYAAFRTAIRIISLANQRNRNRSPINQMLFDLIANGYWSGLLLGVRKLLDKGHLNGGKGVYSIRSVLDDISVCRPKLTRRVYVEQVRNCQYDLDALLAEHGERLRTADGRPTWVSKALILSEDCHKEFDFLSGTAPENRTSDDLIQEAIFERLELRLSNLERISAHVSTHVAHAGNRQSREGKSLDEFDIRDARVAMKELKQLADLVGVWFANEGGAGLATYIGDQFEGLDNALIATIDLDKLEENWRSIDHDISSWRLSPEDL